MRPKIQNKNKFAPAAAAKNNIIKKAEVAPTKSADTTNRKLTVKNSFLFSL